MCGIIGYVNRGGDQTEILKKVIFESRIRGLHSFGYTIKVQGELITKKFHEVNKLLDSLPDKIQAGIFHCRYSTSGDFKNHLNNQPIITPEGSLVFNGVIDMGTKEEMEKRYKIQMQTENDGEIVLKKSEEGFKDFIENQQGSFAGMIMTQDSIRLLRNERRPAYKNQEKDLFIASTNDILLRSGLNKNEEIEPLKELEWVI